MGWLFRTFWCKLTLHEFLSWLPPPPFRIPTWRVNAVQEGIVLMSEKITSGTVCFPCIRSNEPENCPAAQKAFPLCSSFRRWTTCIMDSTENKIRGVFMMKAHSYSGPPSTHSHSKAVKRISVAKPLYLGIWIRNTRRNVNLYIEKLDHKAVA